MLNDIALCHKLLFNLGHSQTVSWSEGRFQRRPSKKASVERGWKCRSPKEATNDFYKQALIYFTNLLKKNDSTVFEFQLQWRSGPVCRVLAKS